MQHVSGVIWFSSLVQKIQRRMVRVIISLVEKISYVKRYPTPKPQTPTLDDAVQASNHNIIVEGNSFRCLQCLGSVSKLSPNCKNWLKAMCETTPFDDSEKHVPVPSWHLVQIGNSIPHSTHQLFSLKGITFCMKCGAFGAKRCRLLVRQCRLTCSVASQRALDRLTSGNLPVEGMAWPRPPGLRRTPPTYLPQPSCQVQHHVNFDDPEDFGLLDAEAYAP